MKPEMNFVPQEPVVPEEDAIQKSERVAEARQRVFDNFAVSFSKENDMIIPEEIKKSVYARFKKGFYDGMDQTAPSTDDLDGAEEYAKRLIAEALEESKRINEGTIDPHAKVSKIEQDFEANVLQDLQAVEGRRLNDDERERAFEAYKKINKKEGYTNRDALEFIRTEMKSNQGASSNPAVDA